MPRHVVRIAAALVAAACLVGASRSVADRLVLDPGASRVRFRLGATWHTVEGTLEGISGSLRFAPGGGAAEGRIALDARTADTGNGMRDERMHDEVLESARYPEIVFRAERLVVEERSPERARVRLEGTLEWHGVERPLVVPAVVRRLEDAGPAEAGGAVAIEGAFPLRYVDWGVPDPSGLLLRVDDRVEVILEGRGRIETGAAAAPSGTGP